MKKPIEKRLNIALYAREWEILQQYMEKHDVDQTQAIRNLLRDWDNKRPPEPPGYVTTDGWVLLPDNIRRQLNLEQGGGISFVANKGTGRIEIWTTAEVEDWLTRKEE